MSSITNPSARPVGSPRRAVVAAGIGNVMEWYDVIIYAYMAPVISQLFFPTEDATVALISTYAGLVLSYLVRPVGAMVIGAYSDRHGRRSALTVTIALMTLGVALIAITPTYASIGIAAPIILLLSRVIQGFSAGGEFGAATTFMAESGRTRRRFLASWQAATQGMAMVLAGLAGFGLYTLVDTAALHGWAWRVPFIFGILVGPVGWWIRSRIPDSEEFLTSEKLPHPLRTTISRYGTRVLVGAMCVGFAGMAVYLITFLAAYSKRLELAPWSGYAGAAAAGLIVAVLAPVFGHLADRRGPIPIMLTATLTGAVVIVPLVSALTSMRTTGMLILVEMVVAVLVAAYFGPLSGLLVELYPTTVRTTGLALSYNLGMIFMGSLGPLLLTAWTTRTLLAPAYYFLIVTVISVVGLLLVRRWIPPTQAPATGRTTGVERSPIKA